MDRYTEIGKMELKYNFTVARDENGKCYRFFVEEEGGKSLHIASIPITDENGNEREFPDMVQYMRENYKLLLLHYIDFTTSNDCAEEDDACDNCSKCN